MLKDWTDIKAYREEKGITLEQISEKMRIPIERIRSLEAGIFEQSDPVIMRLHLKNYAACLGLDYEELLALSGLEEKKEEAPEIVVEQTLVKKTRKYRGRRKKPGKGFVYVIVIAVVIAFLFLLNYLSRHLNIESNLYHMTEMQRKALDENKSSAPDSLLFRPVLPQSAKKVQEKDIYQDMAMLTEFDSRFPLEIKIFPRNPVTYRLELSGEIPLEDIIMTNNPSVLSLRKPGRIIFYNTLESRFVIAELSVRDKECSTMLVDIDDSGNVRLFTASK